VHQHLNYRTIPTITAIALLTAWTSASAATVMDACAAYETARSRLVDLEAAPPKSNPLGRLAMGETQTSEATAEKLRRQNQIDKLAELGHLCVGDLVAAGRFDDAAKLAARAGFLDDALKLAQFAAQQRPK
jgi:hypothetical protein